MYTLKKKNYYISLVLVFILGIGSCLGFLIVTDLGKSLIGEKDDRFVRLQELERFLKDNYYREITDSAITTGLNRGLFASVDDPYTTYYTKEEFELVKNEVHGEFSGIGVVMQSSKDDLIKIIEVVDNAPAQKAGIKKGDKLISVDGEEFNGRQSAEAAAKARGEIGTEVEIKILRDGRIFTFKVTRDNFIDPSVYSSQLKYNLGYIRISSFNDGTADDFRKALNKFENQKASGLVIDIRNNVGGIVSQGVKIADMLLNEANIAYTENNRKEREMFRTKNGKTSLPYVLLINENTASTSEILAVGVKENNGGPLVGVNTYGKGLIQKLEQFDKGDGARITIMQYFSASGQPINNVGVAPDYKVEQSEDQKTDIQLEKALSLMKK